LEGNWAKIMGLLTTEVHMYRGIWNLKRSHTVFQISFPFVFDSSYIRCSLALFVILSDAEYETPARELEGRFAVKSWTEAGIRLVKEGNAVNAPAGG
jgi:hypothetical protein